MHGFAFAKSAIKSEHTYFTPDTQRMEAIASKRYASVYCKKIRLACFSVLRSGCLNIPAIIAA